MQVRPKIVQIFAVTLIVSLILGACGGGTTGSTWFNLPSAKVHVQADGTARVWGYNVGYIGLTPALIQQLQSANIQELEVRIGYNGIHVYANGEDLPYIPWDQESVETLQDILPALPNVPNAELIANALPWLRTIGLGVELDLPLAEGASELDIPRWNGETEISEESPEEFTLGPLSIGSLTFDESGSAYIEGVPVSTFESALGADLPLELDPNTVDLLEQLSAEAVQVSLHPNGIDLTLNDRPLPGIAYDSAYLERTLTYLPAFVSDEDLLAILTDVIPQLTAADVTMAISFTGEQTLETEMPPIEANLTPEGNVIFLGVPVAQGVVPADTIQMLEEANIQRVQVTIGQEGMRLTVNNQLMPTIDWTEESLATIAEVVGPATFGPEGFTSLLDVVIGLGPNVILNVPPAEGAEAIEVSADAEPSFVAPEADPDAPTLHLRAGVDSQGNITMLGGIPTASLSELGVSLPALPADVVDLLATADAQEIQLLTEPGALVALLDGEEALRVSYDTASLQSALSLAAAFMGDSPLTEPGVSTLLNEQILPLLPVSNLDVVLTLE